MAHALNNPLTYVVLNLDYVEPRLAKLASDSTELADCMKSLTEAREGAERMATVVKRMRGFARTEESATRPLDLRHVLESVVELVGHEIHHRGKLATRFEDVPPTIANESKLEQICLGLLLFATQMLPDDAAQRHAVRLSLETNEHHSNVIEIVCEGFTLESNRVEQLFDPFASTSDAKTRGYGLSVCRSLVEQLGGHLVAEPLPGTGLLLRTTFPCISVPRPPDSSRESLPPSTIPGSRSGRARILLIDDDPGVGHALELMLAGEHDVKCFEAPQAALRELLGDPNYDLVFCDLMMPKLSGIDLFEVLRYNRPGYEAKLVFMTGGAFTPANTRFLTQVPNPRIEKPFNLPVIRRLVQRAVRKRNEAVQG
jgi:CheY-like chemotaxis protein